MRVVFPICVLATFVNDGCGVRIFCPHVFTVAPDQTRPIDPSIPMKLTQPLTLIPHATYYTDESY